MSDLVYMFASLAPRVVDGVPAREGMRLLADTLHPLGVKITWMVSAESAGLTADELTSWHEAFGDDVAVCTPNLQGSFDEKKTAMAAERDGVCAALAWANPRIAAAGHQDPEIAAILEDLGFEGLWGFCWEQIEIDEITDRGCPWGFYYMDRSERLRPASGKGVIGMEWTARDLLKSYHSGNPSLYSTDPNDVARGLLCAWDSIDYWCDMADQYIRNLRYNPRVFLLQHQEAHEMECTPQHHCYTSEDVHEAAVMLDRFVRHIQSSINPPDRLLMLTLQEAADLYRSENPCTASSYMLWDDIPVPPPNPDYVVSLARGPWPRTFLHYDRGAQMMFVEGKIEPVCIRNYGLMDMSKNYFEEVRIPRVKLLQETRYTWRKEIVFSVVSHKTMPYGLALWGDYQLYQLGQCEGMLEGKIMEGVLFLRYDLREGENIIHIRLEGK